jgi:plastocyanin domain-containing protein
MKKNLPWILVGILFLVSVFIMVPKNERSIETPIANVVVREGVQYITVHARGGYTPRTSTVQPGLPTKLIVKTNNTYDCSSSLVVRSANYRGMLPASGETEIDLGIPKTGEKIQGTCSMGMYSFSINVN